MRKSLKIISMIVLMPLCLAACGNDGGVSSKEYAALVSENAKNKTEVGKLEKRIAELTSVKEEIQEERDSYAEELERIQKEYDSYRESMQEYEGLQEAEAEARKIEAQRIIEEQKAEEERKAAEEERKAAEEAEKREQEEKAGYDTGITYSQLARTPDDYVDKKVKFQGKVLQVLEDAEHDYIHIRLAVNGSYDDVLYCEYKKDIVSQRILEDDTITIYGVSYGLYTYDTAIGGKKTIPAVIIDKIDQ